ncbi:hypothetical protein PPERSA_04756 [Pseudocohnilembus persalinus]|uniref:Transmembrane protein n=1 Tax=Pseudocohnilembus persalinus TaxID=266149 RepID=A0A0V0QNP1_PSEPJ|nr:hypothetical protein PPERSA_04756 [Pseudocohnilembus persalinus]|eukprot:KRX03878.1 hypothetical protein PPERSA_04756 [Pseudocohnilembus persalinus]
MENQSQKEEQNVSNVAQKESKQTLNKYTLQQLQQTFQQIDNNHQYQENRVYQYMDVIFDDITNFFNKIMGKSYKQKNDFSFMQKQKIMRYLYQKNRQMVYDSKKVKNQDYKYDDENLMNQDVMLLNRKISQSEQIKKENRINFMNSIGELQNRMRLIGFMWGSLLGGVFWVSFLRKQNLTRKSAMLLLCFHLGGQTASSRYQNLIFDSCYPLFEQDLNNFIANEQKRRNEGLNRGINENEVDRIIKDQVSEYNKNVRQIIKN